MEQIIACPDPRACLGQWNAYAESSRTPGQRAERQARAPAHLRDQIESHLRTCDGLRIHQQPRRRP